MNKQVEQPMQGEALRSADRVAIAALARAQSQMGKALKGEENAHFKKKYADLASVRAAAVPALNENGFAVMQIEGSDERGPFVETVFAHESGHQFQTRTPLRGNLPDMQKYGSAVTYARRYGLMSLAGIAPEDDDGNAAAQGGPQKNADRITEQEFLKLRDRCEALNVNMTAFLNQFGVRQLPEIPADRFTEAMRMLDAKEAKMKADANA